MGIKNINVDGVIRIGSEPDSNDNNVAKNKLKLVDGANKSDGTPVMVDLSGIVVEPVDAENEPVEADVTDDKSEENKEKSRNKYEELISDKMSLIKNIQALINNISDSPRAIACQGELKELILGYKGVKKFETLRQKNKQLRKFYNKISNEFQVVAETPVFLRTELKEKINQTLADLDKLNWPSGEMKEEAQKSAREIIDKINAENNLDRENFLFSKLYKLYTDKLREIENGKLKETLEKNITDERIQKYEFQKFLLGSENNIDLEKRAANAFSLIREAKSIYGDKSEEYKFIKNEWRKLVKEIKDKEKPAKPAKNRIIKNYGSRETDEKIVADLNEKVKSNEWIKIKNELHNLLKVNDSSNGELRNRLETLRADLIKLESKSESDSFSILYGEISRELTRVNLLITLSDKFKEVEQVLNKNIKNEELKQLYRADMENIFFQARSGGVEFSLKTAMEKFDEIEKSINSKEEIVDKIAMAFDEVMNAHEEIMQQRRLHYKIASLEANIKKREDVLVNFEQLSFKEIAKRMKMDELRGFKGNKEYKQKLKNLIEAELAELKELFEMQKKHKEEKRVDKDNNNESNNKTSNVSEDGEIKPVISNGATDKTEVVVEDAVNLTESSVEKIQSNSINSPDLESDTNTPEAGIEFNEKELKIIDIVKGDIDKSLRLVENVDFVAKGFEEEDALLMKKAYQKRTFNIFKNKLVSVGKFLEIQAEEAVKKIKKDLDFKE